MSLLYVPPFLTERCTLSSQMWEKAIELGKQLAKMHESHMFDFMELSQLLVRGHMQFNSAVNTITHTHTHLKTCDDGSFTDRREPECTWFVSFRLLMA